MQNFEAREPEGVAEVSEALSLEQALLSRRVALHRYFAVRVGETEADEVIQEMFVRIASLAEIPEIRSQGGYLYRLGTNIMLDRMRQSRARAARDHAWRSAHHRMAPGGEDVSDVPGPDDVVIGRDQLRRLQAALEELPADVQRSFRLHKFDGLSHAEVALRIGSSRSLVEKHIMRALRHLLARMPR